MTINFSYTDINKPNESQNIIFTDYLRCLLLVVRLVLRKY